MYLSRVMLNTQSRETMIALVSPSKFHGAVEDSLKNTQKRKLWRIDYLGGQQYLLVLSEDIPDLDDISKQFGFSGRYETKEYTTLLDRITEGGKWRFRLVANPTISKSQGNLRGKVLAHIMEKYQKEWLIKKAGQCGFSVGDDLLDSSFSITQSKWYKFYKKDLKNSRLVRFLSVSYEGILTVTDTRLFQRALCQGIGREKVYGMGLLTIAGIKESENVK